MLYIKWHGQIIKIYLTHFGGRIKGWARVMENCAEKSRPKTRMLKSDWLNQKGLYIDRRHIGFSSKLLGGKRVRGEASRLKVCPIPSDSAESRYTWTWLENLSIWGLRNLGLRGKNNSVTQKSKFPSFSSTSRCLNSRVWGKWVLPRSGTRGTVLILQKPWEALLSLGFGKALKVSFSSFLKLSGIW